MTLLHIGAACVGFAGGYVAGLRTRRVGGDRRRFSGPLATGLLGAAIAVFALVALPVLPQREWSDDVTQVTNAPALTEALARNGDAPVLVEFFATWCGPCRATIPKLNTLAGEGYPVVVIDIDKAPGLVQTHGVSAVPTLLLFINGTEAARFSQLPALDELRELLQGDGA